jgi:hypothetical protein
MGMVRPKASAARRRRHRRYPTGFLVRCTAAEKQEIFARARRADRSASRFVVEIALQATPSGAAQVRSSEELTTLEGLTVQLRRLGSNLSELARREHDSAYEEADAPADAEIQEALEEVRRMLDRLRSRLL